MWTSTSIVPVSRYIDHVILFPFPVIWFYAINRAQVQLSCYPYHVFLLPCILDISDHKDNLGMGETRRSIRSYRVDVWIHCSSHCRGRGSAGYHLLLMLHVTAQRAGPGLSSQESDKAVVPGMYGIHPPDKNSSTMSFQLT